MIADVIGMEHFSGDKLPAGMAKAIAEGEFVACINPETVGEGQSPTGFFNDGPLVSARDQERADAKKKKRLESHERFGDWFKISDFRGRRNCTISGHPESISKSGHILISAVRPCATK